MRSGAAPYLNESSEARIAMAIQKALAFIWNSFGSKSVLFEIRKTRENIHK